MSGYGDVSPYVMRRIHGWGPKGKTCGDCISYADESNDFEEESVCDHPEVPHMPFYVASDFKACGLFESQRQRERRLLEAQGQQCICFQYRGRADLF